MAIKLSTAFFSAILVYVLLARTTWAGDLQVPSSDPSEAPLTRVISEQPMVWFESATAETATFNITFHIWDRSFQPAPGSITFAGVNYTDGQIGEYPADNYSAIAYESAPHCGVNYNFSEWGSSEGVTVAEKYARNTTATVTGSGDLAAFYETSIADCFPTLIFPVRAVPFLVFLLLGVMVLLRIRRVGPPEALTTFSSRYSGPGISDSSATKTKRPR